MIHRLFARLTGEPRRGQALFDMAVAEARRPHWFIDGAVPDTVDGRFAMLATVTALLIVRLEQERDAGEAASVALTERFVEAMDTEIREMGIGDPSLGKQVRRLVGALGGRVERWRSVVAGDNDWAHEVLRSLYGGEAPGDRACVHSEAELQALWGRILATGFAELRDGRLA